MFTCLSSRAVHIEVVESLDTDSFINCLQRFIARHGLPELIRSDNGRNFVGAERELRQGLRAWEQEKIGGDLSEKGVRWIFNTPTASHMGGVWERQIRSVRRILSRLTREQVMSSEVLTTLLVTAEGILNNRPLTAASSDPSDLEPLTPNHLLIHRPARPAWITQQRRFEAREEVETGPALGRRILAQINPGVLAASETANQVAATSQECQPGRFSFGHG